MTDNQLKPTDEKSNEKSLSPISNEEVISESLTIEETEQQLVDDVDVAVADEKEEKITTRPLKQLLLKFLEPLRQKVIIKIKWPTEMKPNA